MKTLKKICLSVMMTVFACVLASAQEINVSGTHRDKT